MTILLCIAVFLATYLINATTISLFYHRGLAHDGLILHPRLRRFVATWGIWLTGLDPKAWVCMHRRHHAFSDTPDDPHSPVHYGFVGVLLGQLRSYEKTLVKLIRRDRAYSQRVNDLEFPISWVIRKRMWFLPYAVHLGVAVALSAVTGIWGLGAAYFLGMMSHPLEGWAVNSLGHAMGGRNFAIADNSRNNHFAAWLIMGEGYQNNHHAYPRSAKFSYRAPEVDLGYRLSLVLQRTGMLRVREATLIPAPADREAIDPGLESASPL